MSVNTLGFLIIVAASAWAAVDYRIWGRSMLVVAMIGGGLMIGG